MVARAASWIDGATQVGFHKAVLSTLGGWGEDSRTPHSITPLEIKVSLVRLKSSARKYKARYKIISKASANCLIGEM